METKKRNRLITIVGVAVFVIFGISTYNSLVNLEENVFEQWANVEASYQRRADLIPNLVSTVKGYAEHEQETLTGVIEARSKATSTTIDPSKLDANSIQQYQAAQNGLSQALSKLMVVVERYPELKASQNFNNLQTQLEGTENRITVERRKYNSTVKEFNKKQRRLFPSLVSRIAGMKRKAPFSSFDGAEKAPEVNF